MLQLIGIKKHVDIHIREKLTLLPQKRNIVLERLALEFEEVVIVSTCNRTEIYINDNKDINIYLSHIFNIIEWDEEYLNYCFVAYSNLVSKHLFEVSCGFHSRILGEDQILGQIKDAYNISLKMKCIKGELQKLFEDALSCGKKFRTESKLYEIPVSSSSIAVTKAYEHNVKRLMVIGYGEVGKLVIKYALSNNFNEIFLVVRDKEKAREIDKSKVKVLDFNEKNKYINYVDGIISCTSSSHLIIHKKDIDSLGNNLVIFDLAVPRDVDKELKSLTRVKLYDIDDIGILDNENKKIRKDRMKQNKNIVERYYNEFNNWLSVREISKNIKSIKENESIVIQDRVNSFKNKCKSKADIILVETLIKSTSDYYVNRAIETLKEAKLNGSDEECLRIIEKIFMRD